MDFRGPYPSKTLTRIKFNDTFGVRIMENGSGLDQIIMKNKSGVKEGDSFGALSLLIILV